MEKDLFEKLQKKTENNRFGKPLSVATEDINTSRYLNTAEKMREERNGTFTVKNLNFLHR
jgi:hypothetical protein